VHEQHPARRVREHLAWAPLGRRARHGLIPLLVATVAIAGPAVQPALATDAATTTVGGATITVNTIAHTFADDGTCSFIEAITAANKDLASGAQPGECAAGSGADTIRFAPTIQADPVDFYSGGPDIESDLTIDGGSVVTLDLGGLGHLRRNAGTVVLKGLTIKNGQNGGIWNQAPGSLTVEGSQITATSAGSGIYNAGTLTVRGTLIDHNTNPVAGGGGLQNDTGATATVLDSYIFDNVAQVGGGISNKGTLTVQRSTINLNSSQTGGGLYNDGITSVSSSTFLTNHSGGSGGAIYNIHQSLALDNVTVVDNTADGGTGGISNSAILAMTNATVTGNHALPGLAAFTTVLVAGAESTVRNSIIAGNTLPDLGGGVLTAASGHNQVGPLAGAVPLTTWLDAAPAYNGGPTQTVALVNSALNPFATGGDPAVCAVAPVGGVDQRGVKRPAGTCSIGAVELERTKPSTTTPATGFQATGPLSFDTLVPIVQLAGSSAKAHVTWTGKDNAGGSGVRFFEVARSVNGGRWSTVAPRQGLAFYDAALAPGKHYRFRVRAVDNDGNVAAWVTGPTITPSLVQQTSSAVHYRGTWSRSSKTAYSGGSVRFAKAAGASASYTATGRAFGFVTTMGPDRGKARIYVDGRLKTTLDLSAQVPFYRVQAWSARFSKAASHTIKVVVAGTSGRPRADLDAFVILK
jgi:hypothetical protein